MFKQLIIQNSMIINNYRKWTETHNQIPVFRFRTNNLIQIIL
jgi:hypothetical protein